jgi:hypothetical protein
MLINSRPLTLSVRGLTPRERSSENNWKKTTAAAPQIATRCSLPKRKNEKEKLTH